MQIPVKKVGGEKKGALVKENMKKKQVFYRKVVLIFYIIIKCKVLQKMNINVGNNTCIFMDTPVRDGRLPRILLPILFCIHTG